MAMGVGTFLAHCFIRTGHVSWGANGVVLKGSWQFNDVPMRHESGNNKGNHIYFGDHCENN